MSLKYDKINTYSNGVKTGSYKSVDWIGSGASIASGSNDQVANAAMKSIKISQAQIENCVSGTHSLYQHLEEIEQSSLSNIDDNLKEYIKLTKTLHQKKVGWIQNTVNNILVSLASYIPFILLITNFTHIFSNNDAFVPVIVSIVFLPVYFLLGLIYRYKRMAKSYEKRYKLMADNMTKITNVINKVNTLSSDDIQSGEEGHKTQPVIELEQMINSLKFEEVRTLDIVSISSSIIMTILIIMTRLILPSDININHNLLSTIELFSIALFYYLTYKVFISKSVNKTSSLFLLIALTLSFSYYFFLLLYTFNHGLDSDILWEIHAASAILPVGNLIFFIIPIVLFRAIFYILKTKFINKNFRDYILYFELAGYISIIYILYLLKIYADY